MGKSSRDGGGIGGVAACGKAFEPVWTTGMGGPDGEEIEPGMDAPPAWPAEGATDQRFASPLMSFNPMPTNTVDYSQDGKQKKCRFNLRVVGWGLFVLVFLGLAFYTIMSGPSSADIRLDTGDLRYRYFGVPLVYRRTAEPQRSQLLKIAAGFPLLTSEWFNCVTYPQHGSPSPDAMYHRWYMAAAAWIPEDPHLARLVLEDLARLIRQVNGQGGLPDSVDLLDSELLVSDPQNNLTVQKGWQQDAQVAAYLQMKGYMTPSTQPEKAK